MTDAHAIRGQISAVVEEHLGGDVRVEDVTRLLGGSSRELWAFELVVGEERRPLVLRRDPEGVGDREGRRREWEALRAAWEHGVPVPEPLWFVEEGDGAGTVMERVEGEARPGRILRDPRFEDARRGLVDDLAAAAARTHAVPLAAVPSASAEGWGGGATPGGGAAPGDTAPAQRAIAALESELDRIGEPHPALELGLRWLRAHLPPPVAPVLVHGDLRLGNVLVGEDGLRAVLDWELCHAGDGVEDLGWLCVRSWRFGADDRPAAGVGDRDRLLEAYTAAGGRDVSREELRFWEVHGNVRWGVICLAQADIHLSGARRSLEHAAIGRRACEAEWDALAMIG